MQICARLMLVIKFAFIYAYIIKFLISFCSACWNTTFVRKRTRTYIHNTISYVATGKRTKMCLCVNTTILHPNEVYFCSKYNLTKSIA